MLFSDLPHPSGCDMPGIILDDKLLRLRMLLLGYGRVAIAFSGGVDSSLLLRCALDILGIENVLVLFAQSVLVKKDDAHRASHWLEAHGYSPEAMEVLHLQPLDWEEFVRNGEDRCYRCKHRMYSLFLELMELRGFSYLVDGTNTDDLKAHRPGLRAIHDIGVQMPLVEAGFAKADIRRLSKRLGLATWNCPSASCLATRIPSGMEITGERLRHIDLLEKGLESLGLKHTRVRLQSNRQDVVCLEIQTGDFETVANPAIRLSIQRFFRKYGVDKVLLDLAGRT